MVTATTTHVPPILTEWWNANSNATALGYADKGSFASESEHSDESPVTARGSSAAACLRERYRCWFYGFPVPGQEDSDTLRWSPNATTSLKSIFGDTSLGRRHLDVSNVGILRGHWQPELSVDSISRLIEGRVHPSLSSEELTHRFFFASFLLVTEFRQRSHEPPIIGNWAESRVPASEMVVRYYLPRLVSASPKERKEIRNVLFRFAEPRSLWRYAFKEYDRTRREAYLLHALSLLEDFGESSWPALKEIANSKREECELFSGAIARCPGVPKVEKIGALLALASNPCSFVRSGLFEKLSQLPSDVVRPILEALSRDDDPEIGEEAREGLRALDGPV